MKNCPERSCNGGDERGEVERTAMTTTHSEVALAAAAMHIIRACILPRTCACGGTLATYASRYGLVGGHAHCTHTLRPVRCTWVEYVVLWWADLEYFRELERCGEIAGFEIKGGEFIPKGWADDVREVTRGEGEAT